MTDLVESLRSELDQLKKAAPLCEDHKPNGGTRANCLICGLQELSAALSEIDYLCGPPNEMHVSAYDVFCEPKMVVDNVRKALTKLKQSNDMLKHSLENAR